MDDIVEDGFYVVGEATAIANLSAENAAKGLMGAGFNEADKTYRAGMYEKYIALEGGKEFELVLKEGGLVTRYGAELALSDTLEGENVPQIQVYQGVMAENTKMQVPQSGLYHIILDLNKNEDLANKLIMVVPVEWGVRGAMNGWGYSGYASVAWVNSKTGMATPEQFINLEAISGGKVVPTIYKNADGTTNMTDWMAELTRKAAVTHSHTVAVTGSHKRFNYRASVNFKNAEGIAKNNNRMEINAKLAAQQKALNGWLELQYDFAYLHYRNDYFCGDFTQAAIANPTYPIYDPSTPSGYFTTLPLPCGYCHPRPL